MASCNDLIGLPAIYNRGSGEGREVGLAPGFVANNQHVKRVTLNDSYVTYEELLLNQFFQSFLSRNFTHDSFNFN